MCSKNSIHQLMFSADKQSNLCCTLLCHQVRRKLWFWQSWYWAVPTIDIILKSIAIVVNTISLWRLSWVHPQVSLQVRVGDICKGSADKKIRPKLDPEHLLA
jgi:hypothetical protein